MGNPQPAEWIWPSASFDLALNKDHWFITCIDMSEPFVIKQRLLESQIRAKYCYNFPTLATQKHPIIIVMQIN